MKPAFEHPLLCDLLLQKTYVFDFELHPGSVIFSVQFALAETHPQYEGPLPGEAFDFRRGTLIFSGVSRAVWVSTGGQMTHDADGSRDWDTFDEVSWEESSCELSGDFGIVSLTAQALDIFMEPRSEATMSRPQA